MAAALTHAAIPRPNASGQSPEAETVTVEPVALLETSDEDDDKYDSQQSAFAHMCDKFGTFLITHLLPVGLAVLLVFGLVYPDPGDYLDGTPLSMVLICMIFFVSGLNLATNAIRQVKICTCCVCVRACVCVCVSVCVYVWRKYVVYFSNTRLFVLRHSSYYSCI
jgi:hypothetical protein